jgi:hypothetical protein
VSRPRISLGIFVGAIIVASSVAHSLLGWREFGARLTGLVYLAFGLWALAVSRFDPFFFIFIVPGLTLVAVAWWPTTVPMQQRI